MASSRRTLTCSAPGKILIAGGYLVLDPGYNGLVLSLSARIFATITPGSSVGITVHSPQFVDAIWKYTYDGSLVHEHGCNNPFVKEALQTCLTYFDPIEAHFDMFVFADNQYYSLPLSSSRFAFSSKSISETPKTGLGSSAALVTSLCATIFLYLTGKDASYEFSDTDQSKIHNLAQIAHSRAQGKVGSGFDIASAVYGSCVYARFPATLIDELPRTEAASAELYATMKQELRDVVDTKWPMISNTVKLRPGLRLLMGDVEQGSSTPGMVKKVMASSAALELWSSLAISNDVLADYLTGSSPYNAAEEPAIREATRSVRGLLKQMGKIADVEIEPDSQTSVLDETLAISGVVACGVPGAGGYDAIYAIVADEGEAAGSVRSLWQQRSIRALDVRESGTGIQVESGFDLKHYLQNDSAGS